MGIFSGLKNIALPGLGAGIGALLALPTGGLSVAAGAAIGGGLGFNFDGANEQADALEKAGKVQEANALRQQALQQQFLQETQEFRQLAKEQIPGLRQEAAAAPGTSPLFKRGLQEGLTGLQEQFSALGLGSSGAFGEAAGRFTEGLAASDINRITSLKASLASGATTGFGPSLGAAQLGQGAAGGLSSLLTAQGAARGGALGDIGSSLITMPLLASGGFFGNSGTQGANPFGGFQKAPGLGGR